MIVGLTKNRAGECFRELNNALVAMGRGDVVLNAHVAPEEIPEGATVWHFENQPCDYPKAREVWTFSKRQAEATGWRYVSVGYHPSMERFERAAKQDLDVVMVGCVNERRMQVARDIAARGHEVTLVPPGIYGKERDGLLARAKLVVAPLYYPDGVFCSLRAAHLVANRVPCLFETAPEAWEFVAVTAYDNIVDVAALILSGKARFDTGVAYDAFRTTPLELPC